MRDIIETDTTNDYRKRSLKKKKGDGPYSLSNGDMIYRVAQKSLA